MSAVIEQIAALRKLHRMSRRELAERSGVNASIIERAEKGITVPLLDNLEALAQVFNCEVSLIARHHGVTEDHESIVPRYSGTVQVRPPAWGANKRKATTRAARRDKVVAPSQGDGSDVQQEAAPAARSQAARVGGA